MIYIGCHLSASDGYEAMGKTMTAYGGKTFAWFTRNPRGGKSKAVDIEDVNALRLYCTSYHFGPLVAHAPYTMNLCSAKEETRLNGLDMLRRDIERMEMLPGNYYNLHPGSHTGQGVVVGIQQIADALNMVLKPDMHTTVLLETMAGKGSEVGGRFEDLAEIIDRIKLKERIGVCFDTCHVWDAGYDVADIDGTLKLFDDVVGLSYLKAVHLNDSKNERGSQKDRHERLGEGHLGMETIKRVVLHPALQGLPFILETPNEAEGYIQEIGMVREMFEKEPL